LDYTVTPEGNVPGGQGRADLVLRRGNRAIACEITVSTPAEHEVANVQKCLRGGFGHVALICASRRKLANLEQAVAAALPPDQVALVGFYLPEDFMARLYDWAMEDPEGGAVERDKPRKQKIQLGTADLTEADRKQIEKTMLSRLAEAMKRKQA